MARGKSSRKERDRKRREDEKAQHDLELSQVDVEKNLEKQKEDNEEQELHRLEVERLREKQKRVTKEKFQQLSKRLDCASRQRWETQSWTKYVSCDGRPDIEDQRQVNSFISRWTDGTIPADTFDGADHLDPISVLVQCDRAIKLIEEIDDLLCEARHLPIKTAVDCASLKVDLQDAIKAKLDRSTLHFLKTTSLCAEPETGNSYFYGKNGTIELSIWSNLSCNSRYGGTEAKELGMSFVLPRSLVITECAVRFLKVSADSPLISSTNRKDPRAMMMDVAWNSSSHENETNAVERSTAKSRFQMNLRSDGGGGDGDCESESFVDLDEYFIVGSSVDVDLLAIPPQPRTIKNWVITRVQEPDTLRHVEWISEFAGVVCNVDDDDTAVKIDDESEREQFEKQAQEELKKLVHMSIRMSDEVLWSDVPKLARREACVVDSGEQDEQSTWTTLGLHQIVHKEDINAISFYAARFGTFALFQSRFASFPYQSWEMSPCDTPNLPCQRVSFSLTTMLASIKIEIQAGSCTIREVQSNEKSFLKSIYGQAIKPTSLFKRLQAAGIYVTPCERDCLYTTNIKQKDKRLEVNVYRQMSVAAASYVFSSSRWNSNVGRDKIVIRSRLPSHPPDKAKQPVILVTESEATLLCINELSQAFGVRPMDENSVAGDLCHVVETIGSSDGHRVPLDVDKIDPLFMDTVFLVLSACRILRF